MKDPHQDLRIETPIAEYLSARHKAKQRKTLACVPPAIAVITYTLLLLLANISSAAAPCQHTLNYLSENELQLGLEKSGFERAFNETSILIKNGNVKLIGFKRGQSCKSALTLIQELDSTSDYYHYYIRMGKNHSVQTGSHIQTDTQNKQYQTKKPHKLPQASLPLGKVYILNPEQLQDSSQQTLKPTAGAELWLDLEDALAYGSALSINPSLLNASLPQYTYEFLLLPKGAKPTTSKQGRADMRTLRSRVYQYTDNSTRSSKLKGPSTLAAHKPQQQLRLLKETQKHIQLGQWQSLESLFTEASTDGATTNGQTNSYSTKQHSALSFPRYQIKIEKEMKRKD